MCNHAILTSVVVVLFLFLVAGCSNSPQDATDGNNVTVPLSSEFESPPLLKRFGVVRQKEFRHW